MRTTRQWSDNHPLPDPPALRDCVIMSLRGSDLSAIALAQARQAGTTEAIS